MGSADAPVTIRPSDYQELATLARQCGYLLRATASIAERFELRRRGDQAIACTFVDLDAVRDWLTD